MTNCDLFSDTYCIWCLSKKKREFSSGTRISNFEESILFTLMMTTRKVSGVAQRAKKLSFLGVDGNITFNTIRSEPLSNTKIVAITAFLYYERISATFPSLELNTQPSLFSLTIDNLSPFQLDLSSDKNRTSEVREPVS